MEWLGFSNTVLWETQGKKGRRRRRGIMILRTPPPPKRPRADADADADRQLVIYEDPPSSSQDPQTVSEHMLCTYQCRQMVGFLLSNFIHSPSASASA